MFLSVSQRKRNHKWREYSEPLHLSVRSHEEEFEMSPDLSKTLLIRFCLHLECTRSYTIISCMLSWKLISRKISLLFELASMTV